MSPRELANNLKARDPGLAKLRSQWKVVDDVLAGADALRCQDYLPQHMNEHEEEYAKRLKLTPVFRETPEILQRRQGALFKQPPTINLPERMKYLFKRATLSGMNVYDLSAKLGEHSQCNGYVGVLVDRPVLPADVAARGGAVSGAEAEERKLGLPIFALFMADQILEARSDGEGLTWIKLIESSERRARWDSKPEQVHRVRIVDRVMIQVYEIIETEEGEPTVNIGTPLPHGGLDAAGAPVVPFRLFDPFPAKDGRGRPVLKDSAEADAAALWVLSELLWTCYHTFPILTFTTAREEDEAEQVAENLSTSRFVILRSGNSLVGANEEKLAFSRLDAAAIDSLDKIHQKLADKARESGGRKAAAAVPVATEQSGVSKAWTFKTGEGRILFLLSLNLQAGLQWLLELASRMQPDSRSMLRRVADAVKGAVGKAQDDSGVSVSFPESFDIADPSESFAAKTEAADYFEAKGINSAVVPLLMEALEAILPDIDEKSWEEIEAEVKALKNRELRPGAILDKNLPTPEDPPKPGEKIPAKPAA